MKRREFLVVAMLLGAAVRRAVAQQPLKMKRLALVDPAISPDEMRIGGDPNYAILFEEVKRLGYVEGKNLLVHRYSAEGQFNRFAEIAHEVVATQPDVIFGITNQLVLALKSETRTIPIVAYTVDP